MRARPPRTQRPRTCLTCRSCLERKRTGRPARYCSDRFRDKAYALGTALSAEAPSGKGKVSERQQKWLRDIEARLRGERW
jgi:hypothetical protein